MHHIIRNVLLSEVFLRWFDQLIVGRTTARKLNLLKVLLDRELISCVSAVMLEPMSINAQFVMGFISTVILIISVYSIHDLIQKIIAIDF